MLNKINIMDQVAEFTTKFYNLDGDTLSERRKNLFMLLHSFKSTPQSVKLEVTSGLNPRNHMEVVFRLEVLIFFRCYDALLEILMTEISDITRKILKQRWFIHQLFHSFTPDGFVNEVLPRFSVVNRRRLLNYFVKYCKDDQKMNQLFDIVLHVYGLDTARLILTSCSIDKIENIISIYEINLSQRQLINIYYKDQNLFVNILKKSSYYITRRQMQKLRKYVSATYIKSFFDLCKAGYTSLGKRSTRMLLSKYRSDVLQKPLDYMEHIHCKTVGKTFTPEELRLALMNSYADEKSNFWFYPLCRILYLFPQKKRYNIFYETYYEKYNQTLFENPNHMDEDLIEIIDDVEEREKWIVRKVKEGISDTKYIHFYGRNKSLNLIKSKINFTSSYRSRGVLLEKLVELCKFYDDKELLLETLKYVCKRHRNDELLSSYLSELFYSFDLAELNQDCWKYILELLEVVKVKKYYLNPRGSIFLKHIEYLWRNKQPIKDKVIEYVDKEALGEHIFEMKEKNRSLQKILLSILLELIPQKKQDYKTNKINLDLLLWILEWNKNNPTTVYHINNYPTLLNTLKSVLDDNTLEPCFEWIFTDFLCTKDQNELGKYLMDIYFTKLEHYKKTNIKIIMWFLKNNPLALSPYTDNLVQFLYNNIKYNHQIWIYVKKLCKYSFLQKAVEFGVENYEKVPKKAAKLLRTLAFLMNSDQYIALVSKYVPSPEIMETENESDERYLRLFIERGVAKSFIYCRTVNVIPLLLKFCVGETLREGLNSLHYYFIHSPTSTLREVLVNLPFQHAFAIAQTFSLTCEFDNTKNIISLLNSALSMRNSFVLKKALKYARKNPSNELFELLLQPKNFESCNVRILKILKKYVDVPILYKCKIIDTVFDYTANYGEQNILPQIGDVVLKHFEKDLGKIPVEYKTKFLNYSIIHCQIHCTDCLLKGLITVLISNIDEQFLRDVPPEVCISFIDFYFLNDAIDFISDELILLFIVCYLCCALGEMVDKWSFVFNKIKEYMSRNSDSLVAKTKTKRKISILFSLLSVHVASKDIAFIKEFYDLWCKSFEISEGFDVFCFLRISIIVKESSDLTAMCNKLFSLLEELSSLTSLSAFLFDKVASKLKQIYESTTINNKQSLYSLCFTLYECSKSVQNIAFMLSLLPRNAPTNQDDKKKYFDLIQLLSTHEDQLVKIKYNLFMTNS